MKSFKKFSLNRNNSFIRLDWKSKKKVLIQHSKLFEGLVFINTLQPESKNFLDPGSHRKTGFIRFCH